VVEQVRRIVESHVRYHCRNQRATFVGNREIPSLDEPARSLVIAQRDEFEQTFRSVISRGVAEGRFAVGSARLASYAILEMGMGIAGWYREGGEQSESQVAYEYGEMALRILRAPAG
jgi:hypothetical protein